MYLFQPLQSKLHEIRVFVLLTVTCRLEQEPSVNAHNSIRSFHKKVKPLEEYSL